MHPKLFLMYLSLKSIKLKSLVINGSILKKITKKPTVGKTNTLFLCIYLFSLKTKAV